MKQLPVKSILMIALTIGLFGCGQDGPAENAGEKMDEAATDAGNAIEDSCEEAKRKAGAEDTRC